MKAVRGILGGLLLALVVMPTVLGYAGQVAATVEVSGPSGLQACNTPITITARVEDVNGNPIEGQPVDWSFLLGDLAGDTILDTSTITNSNGIATTRVRFFCAPRSVTLGAVADNVSGTVVIRLSGQGLPGTDTAPPSSLLAIALAALAVIIGVGAILRRFATGPR